MGKYNGAVVTTAGQTLLTTALSEGKVVTFTNCVTSTHQYPDSTNFEALTAIPDVEQTESIISVESFSGNILQISARFDNSGVETAYQIYTIGIYAHIESNPDVLVAVLTAQTPDLMPVEDAENPSAFIFNIQMIVSNAESINVEVNPAGTVTVSEFLKVQASLGLIEQMIVNNDYFAPLLTDDATLTALLDDDGSILLADWRYKEA